ncbi:MAG: 2-dehydro-3-deoxygalactonokinase [Rhodoferax sp.]
MSKYAECALVGVDWGTTHRRLYALDAHGQALGRASDEDGAAACHGRFADSLASGLQHLRAAPRRIVLSGMVGSTMGWQLAPYVDAAVALADLPQHLVAVQDAHAPAPAWIVPGYCIRDAQGQPDVMRGEETQLLGALHLGYHSGVFVLPGTHSKWVELVDGRIVRLRTYMTGELFSLLRSQGTLAAAVGSEPRWDAQAFEAGVHTAQQRGALGQQLFGCRARVVCGDLPAASAAAYLSGLLIGSELHDALDASAHLAAQGSVQLIGSPELARHYQQAAFLLGRTVELIDAHAAYGGGLAHIQAHGRFS